MNATLVYSPGYQLPLQLGAAQVRLWRRIDRLLGSRSSSASTVRAIAAATGSNPGAVSRDLGRLVTLGFVARSTTRGRFGGVRLWRVVSRRLRGLDPVRHRRTLRRMGAPAPGQLELAIASSNDRARPWWDTEPEPDNDGYGFLGDGIAGRTGDPEPGSLRAERDPVTPELVAEGAYGTARCPGCGRLRLTFGGEVRPCTHGATR